MRCNTFSLGSIATSQTPQNLQGVNRGFSTVNSVGYHQHLDDSSSSAP